MNNVTKNDLLAAIHQLQLLVNIAQSSIAKESLESAVDDLQDRIENFDQHEANLQMLITEYLQFGKSVQLCLPTAHEYDSAVDGIKMSEHFTDKVRSAWMSENAHSVRTVINHDTNVVEFFLIEEVNANAKS